MEPTLVFDGSQDSFFFKWLLVEKEAPVRFVRVDMRTDPIPIPYYREQDVVIHNHHALLQFLQERYPHQPLLPADPLVRAQIRQVCEFFRDEKTDMIPDINDVLLEKTRWLMGSEFTLVDLYAGSWLRGRSPTGWPIMVKHYFRELSGRPQYIEADK